MKNYTLQYYHVIAESSGKIFWLYLLQRLRLMMLTLTRIRDSLVLYQPFYLKMNDTKTEYIIIFSTTTYEPH